MRAAHQVQVSCCQRSDVVGESERVRGQTASVIRASRASRASSHRAIAESVGNRASRTAGRVCLGLGVGHRRCDGRRVCRLSLEVCVCVCLWTGRMSGWPCVHVGE